MKDNKQFEVLNELKTKLGKTAKFKYCKNDLDYLTLSDDSRIFIWVRTKDKAIGNPAIHYEFIFHHKDKNLLCTEVHIETDQQTNSKAENALCQICADKGLEPVVLDDCERANVSKAYHWYALKGSEIDIENGNYAKKAMDALRNLDDLIGAELRKAL